MPAKGGARRLASRQSAVSTALLSSQRRAVRPPSKEPVDRPPFRAYQGSDWSDLKHYGNTKAVPPTCRGPLRVAEPEADARPI
jgi:hypothetical protein